MSKHKIILIAGGGVSLLLVVATAVITASSVGVASRYRQEMVGSSNKLTSFYKMNPFPSPENIDLEKASLATLEERNKLLFDALSKNEVKLEGEHSPGSFRITCEETINNLRKAAPKGEGGVSVIAPDFYFGFDRYDPSKNGVPADKNDVPRLLRQLKMTDALVRNFYDSGIIKFDAVSREEFDGAAGVSEEGDSSSRRQKASRRGGSARSSAGGLSLKMDVPPLDNAPIGLDRQRFGFVFLAREEALFTVMNKINAMWPFAQISGFELEKAGPDVVFAAPKAEAGAETAGTTPAVKERPLGRTARTVSGKLREAPVKVSMTIDIYTFGTAAPEETE